MRYPRLATGAALVVVVAGLAQVALALSRSDPVGAAIGLLVATSGGFTPWNVRRSIRQ